MLQLLSQVHIAKIPFFQRMQEEWCKGDLALFRAILPYKQVRLTNHHVKP